MPQQKTVITPIIHLNGDRAETLIQRLEATWDMLDAAVTLLRDCAPNGRNYYPDPGRMEQAEQQYTRRQNQIGDVMESLEAEIAAIQAQQR